VFVPKYYKYQIPFPFGPDLGVILKILFGINLGPLVLKLLSLASEIILLATKSKFLTS